MRRRLRSAAFVLLLALLVTSVAQASYLPPSDGVRNALFVPMEYSAYDGSLIRYSRDDFAKYIVHVDPVTNAKDFMFREFVFAPLYTARGSGPQRSFGPVPGAPAQSAGIRTDWDHYVDELFLQNLPALNDAASGAVNGHQNTVLDVWVALPYPDPKSYFEGNSVQPFWCNNLNRLNAGKNFIDHVLRRWDASPNRSRLRLRGFYQISEDMVYWDPATNPCGSGTNHLDQNWFGQLNDHIHSLGRGLKVLWVPYFGSGFAPGWANYHFDYAVLQPNRFFLHNNGVPDGHRVCHCEWPAALNKAGNNGMGVEMELDGGIWWNPVPGDQYYTGPAIRARFKEYLDNGYQSGFMTQSAHVWFDDDKGMLGLFRTDRNYTYVYDDMYRFVKGTYKPAQSAAIRPTTMNLSVGQTQRAELWGTFPDASSAAVTAAWGSSNSAVATVDRRTGMVQARAAGETTITATYWDQPRSIVVRVH